MKLENKVTISVLQKRFNTIIILVKAKLGKDLLEMLMIKS